MISYTQKQLRDFKISSTKEWLLSDGDGGYACSTISFMNTRRQHSLLTVSTNSPLKRFTLLNKVDEEVIIDGKSFMLSTNTYPGTVFPEGYKLQSKFVFDHFPQVTFDLEGSQIIKKLLMPKGSSSIYLHYENGSKKTMTLRLLPLISFRWRDSIRKAGDGFLVDELPDGVRIISEMNLPRLYLKLSQIYATSPESHWYYDFIYPHDAGLYEEVGEDLFNIGFWETELEPGRSLTLAASTRDLAEFDYGEIEAHYIESVDKLRESSGLPKRYVHLADAASNHLVKNKITRSPVVISGYPYGGLSVRDSLISAGGIADVSQKHNYEQEFFYDLVTIEVGGTLPSGMEELDTQVKYDDPTVSLYFAMALKRCAEKEGSNECLRRYLPIMEDGIEILLQGSQGVTKLKGTHLIDVSGGKPGGLQSIVSNAAANALWYNLLKVIDEGKSPTESLSSYADIAAEIESEYFATFFDRGGAYIGMNADSELTSDMVIPLLSPFSPLDAKQKEIVFRNISSRFLESLGGQHLHAMPGHSCNLLIIYLAEAGSAFEAFNEENMKLRELLTQLLTLREFSNCVDGLPRCGLDLSEGHPQDVSSAVVVGEAIRVIKKLKLK